MWDLETIIRMNNEAFRSSKTQNTPSQSKQEETERNAGVWDIEDRVFEQTSYLRSVYEGELDRHTPQSRSGETLP